MGVVKSIRNVTGGKMVIKKSGSGWVLKTRHKKGGKRRTLGRHKTKKEALLQEKAIWASKMRRVSGR